MGEYISHNGPMPFTVHDHSQAFPTRWILTINSRIKVNHLPSDWRLASYLCLLFSESFAFQNRPSRSVTNMLSEQEPGLVEVDCEGIS
jgi:hypothetical protein